MTVVTSLVARLIVSALVIAAIAGQVAHLDALSGATLGWADTLARNPRPSFLTLVAADAVVSVVSGILAIALIFRGDPERGSSGLGMALAAWSYLLAYSGVIILLRPDPGTLRTLFDVHFPLVELVGLAGLTHFTSIFPRRLVADSLSDPDSLPIGLRTVQYVRIRLLAPSGPWVGALLIAVLLFGTNAAFGRPPADAALNPLMDLVRFAAVAVVFMNLRRSWIDGAPEARGQMGWILVGLALFMGAITLLIGGNIFLSATGWSEPTVAWRPILLDLGLIGFLWGAAMAVFYSGVINAGALARRVVSITALATVVLFVATGLEVLLSSALVGRISLPPGLGTVIVVIGAVATYGRTLPFIDRIIDLIPGVGPERASAA